STTAPKEHAVPVKDFAQAASVGDSTLKRVYHILWPKASILLPPSYSNSDSIAQARNP
ncbi:MAG: hypothetical protein MHM6MM_008786, partial [Cercozoa sp. M6MM]